MDDQQFCLRWNNFQAYITSQFESLRDDEDFVDVTLACGGRKLGAHKVVLSACSPFFKDLFKANPCAHPIIFMRDVEPETIVSLLEFMYAGEVNVAQTNLSGFLRTAESLQIRGLTEATKPKNYSNNIDSFNEIHEKSKVTSTKEEDIDNEKDEAGLIESLNPLSVLNQGQLNSEMDLVEPKLELPEYNSDEEELNDEIGANSNSREAGKFHQMDIEPGTSATNFQGFSNNNLNTGLKGLPISSHRNSSENPGSLIRLGDGVEIREDQLRAVKWGDYRKLTRGLATILFSPIELATCSVTGQRWSRASSSNCGPNRPVKPALPRHKVQALVSYVAQRFPHIEVSRIKQVLAYKCKENSTALKMKAARCFSHEAFAQAATMARPQ